MKRNIIILLLLIGSTLLAQKSDSTKTVSELEKIYSNLEYNTSSFDDIKKQWIITDPEMVRDLSNKFIANNYVKINGKNAGKQFINKFNNNVARGDVAIILRKRFYDNEIEYFAFVIDDDPGNTPLFDPVLDGFYLKSIIGKSLYKELQKQNYFYNDVSKQIFSTKYGYNFNVNLNLLNSDLMFWNTTSNGQNKYLLSFFGDWGNDNIHFPGWTMQEYFLGAQLTYYSKLPPDPRNYKYKLKVGTGIQTSVPYETTVPDIPLLLSGQNAYAGLSLSLFSKNFFVDMEASMTLTDFSVSDFDFHKPTKYNSIRNFFSFKLRAINVANLSDLGKLEMSFGIATHDLNQYEYDPKQGGIVDLIPQKEFMDRFNHFINGSIGVTKLGGLVQHRFNIFVGFNPEEYGYYGFNLHMMLSNTFGFDIRMSNSFGLTNVKYPWRMDSYLVFSPVFRINF
jgi:hypothetical protein